jgi:cysteinyl-tRNA synthetase
LNRKKGNVLDLIGNTPMVEIQRLNPNRRVKIFAKLESFNPGGSVKDRIALSMIEAAERDGRLSNDKIVLEPTSGNTGIGLALVCAVKGYRLLLTMSEGVSMERQKILKALGAEIRLTPAELGTDGAIEEAYRMALEEPERFFVPDQFNNPNNWLAHYHGTAVEIWKQTKGMVSMVVATMGTTGTIMGISRRLKEYNPAIRIIGVEPYLGHKIQGLKNMMESYTPGIYERERLDEKVNIDDEEAFEMARELARKEGIFAGMSSGAAMAIAIKKARQMEEGIICVILPDGGERYLSTKLFVPREISNLCLFNTLSRKKENFAPLQPGVVTIYSCGPTVHELIHLGHCRRFLVADLLRRYLEYKGFKCTQVMNITDLDDNTIAKAEKEQGDLISITKRYTEEFLKDIDTLMIKRASYYPKATEHVDEMIKLARILQKKGFAYEKHRSLYFNISKFRDYGKLSRVDIGKIKVGMTVDVDQYGKDNPRDFTLFKRSTLMELKKGIYYKTDWGNCRPGWHIECPAMAMAYLGESIDIHTSSTDLIFPHHENEIAISESATGRRFVNYWIHSEMVLVNGKKMSYSQGNVISLRDLLEKGFTGKEIRLFFLSTHYRKPLKFSIKALFQTRETLRRMNWFIYRLQILQDGESNPDIGRLMAETEDGFERSLDDDLNISGALASIFVFMRKVNHLMSEGKISSEQANSILKMLQKFNQVLEVMDFEKTEAIDREIESLLQSRERARMNKNWEEADRIREILLSMGIKIQDTKEGTIWRRENGKR